MCGVGPWYYNFLWWTVATAVSGRYSRGTRGGWGWGSPQRPGGARHGGGAAPPPRWAGNRARAGDGGGGRRAAGAAHPGTVRPGLPPPPPPLPPFPPPLSPAAPSSGNRTGPSAAGGGLAGTRWSRGGSVWGTEGQRGCRGGLGAVWLHSRFLVTEFVISARDRLSVCGELTCQSDLSEAAGCGSLHGRLPVPGRRWGQGRAVQQAGRRGHRGDHLQAVWYHVCVLITWPPALAGDRVL